MSDAPEPVPAPLADPAMRLDGLENIISQLGIAGKDWRKATRIVPDEPLTREEIDALYGSDPIAARVVDAIPEHCTRRWISVNVEGGEEADEADEMEEVSKAVLDALDDLDAPTAISDWMAVGRKDGGSLLLLGVQDGQKIDQPVAEDKVEELVSLHVVERWQVRPAKINGDPSSPMFGLPEVFEILPGANPSTLSGGATTATGAAGGVAGFGNGPGAQTLVHASRVIAYRGVKVSERERLRTQNGGYGFFGQSVLQRLRDPLLRYRELWGHTAQSFKNVSQTILKLKGFRALRAQDKDQVLLRELALIQLFRSTMGLVPLDGEDTLEDKEMQLRGAADMLRLSMDDLAAAAEMPLTLLFGHSPSGFSSDDEPGMRNFYDSVALKQRRQLRSPLKRIVELLLRSKSGPTGGQLPDRWAIEFRPLVEPTDEEVSTRRQRDAQTAAVYVAMGALDPDEVRAGLRSDQHSPYVFVDDELREDPEPEPEPAPVDPDPPEE